MLIPIHAATNWVTGYAYTPVPEITTVEKIIFILSAIGFFGGFITMTALLLSPNPSLHPWAYFAMGMSSIPGAIWVSVAHQLSRRPVIEEDKETESATSLEIQVSEKQIDGDFDEESQELIEQIPYFLKNQKEFIFLSHEPPKEKKTDPLTEKIVEKFKVFVTDSIQNAQLPPAIKQRYLEAQNHLFEGGHNQNRAFLVLLPHLFQLFKEMGEERKQVLTLLVPKLKQFLPDHLVMQQDIDQAFEKLFFIIEPLTLLLSKEEFEGKAFLYDAIHQLTFYALPAYLKYYVKKEEEKKESSSQKKINAYKEKVQKSSASIAPQILEAIDAYEKRRRQDKKDHIALIRTLYKFVLPKLSFFSLQETLESEEVSAYLTGLDQTYQAKGRVVQLASEIRVPQYSDLILFSKLMDRMYQDVISRSLTVFDDFKTLLQEAESLEIEHQETKEGDLNANDLEDLVKDVFQKLSEDSIAYPEYRKRVLQILKTAKSRLSHKKYQSFIHDVRLIFQNLQGEVKGYFHETASSPGEVFAKSYLIAHESWNIFSTAKSRADAAKDWMDYFKKPLDASGLDSKGLVTHSTEITSSVLEKVEALDESAYEAFKMLPIQDLIPVLLLSLYSARYLSEVRPFAAKHLSTLFLLLNDLEFLSGYLIESEKIKEGLSKYKGLIHVQAQVIIALLKPVNGLLLESWPGKSWVMKQSISAIVRTALSTYSKEEQKLAQEALLPIALFAVLGIFGSQERERKALKQLEHELDTFYHTLYSFDLNEMAQNPQKLRTHIRQTLEDLWTRVS